MTSVLEPDSGKMADIKPYAYIQKPFDIGHMLQTVEKSLLETKFGWQLAPSIP